MAEGILVRDQCVCGRRYRVRNPVAGFAFKCPNCAREITISQADILLAEPIEETPRFQPTPDGVRGPAKTKPGELLDAKLVDAGEIRLADHGARIGGTGHFDFDSDDARLHAAIRGRPLISASDDEDEWRTVKLPVAAPSEGRTFLSDVAASFVLAGSAGNTIKLGGTALGIALFWIAVNVFFSVLPGIAPIQILAAILICIPATLIAVYLMQLYWHVLCDTINGENELSWVQSDWDLWHDALKPALWLVIITLLCAVPAWAVWAFVGFPPGQATASAIVLLLMGFFFWPVAVMAVAVGGSVFYVRPDWLVRCLIAIGPNYVLAWLVTAVAIGAWIASDFVPNFLATQGVVGDVLLFLFPLFGVPVNVYLGYVLFRTIGLLFRYHRERLPFGY